VWASILVPAVRHLLRADSEHVAARVLTGK
jgi:hypothetical protein